MTPFNKGLKDPQLEVVGELFTTTGSGEQKEILELSDGSRVLKSAYEQYEGAKEIAQVRNKERGLVEKILSPKHLALGELEEEAKQEDEERTKKVLERKLSIESQQGLTKEYVELIKSDFDHFLGLYKQGKDIINKLCGFINPETFHSDYETYCNEFKNSIEKKKFALGNELITVVYTINKFTQEREKIEEIMPNLEGNDIVRGKKSLQEITERLSQLELERDSLHSQIDTDYLPDDINVFIDKTNKIARGKKISLSKSVKGYYYRRGIGNNVLVETPQARPGYYLSESDFELYSEYYERLKLHFKYISGILNTPNIQTIDSSYFTETLGQEDENVLYIIHYCGILGIAHMDKSCQCGQEDCLDLGEKEIKTVGDYFHLNKEPGSSKITFKSKEQADCAYELLKIGRKYFSNFPKSISKTHTFSIKEEKSNHSFYGTPYRYKKDIPA